MLSPHKNLTIHSRCEVYLFVFTELNGVKTSIEPSLSAGRLMQDRFRRNIEHNPTNDPLGRKLRPPLHVCAIVITLCRRIIELLDKTVTSS